MAQAIYTAQGKAINPKRELRTVTSKVTIYNVETGESAKKHPVDAKEQVAAGRWSYEPVVAESDTEPKTDQKTKRPSRGRKQ